MAGYTLTEACPDASVAALDCDTVAAVPVEKRTNTPDTGTPLASSTVAMATIGEDVLALVLESATLSVGAVEPVSDPVPLSKTEVPAPLLPPQAIRLTRNENASSHLMNRIPYS
ncbi:hypothetical protein CATMQ487_13790 [Sphaerotilus microaerophilus]|uniref:Uncharacterized protein n=1 Tax=Sphaerotilus microaerophilus TaxID=2914710 RepID=A0ABN6PHC6_9BURK|nr:hypothetical protein CATMQ487_13790 [Sphaerotilus sp. FB-5]